jgi:hypothetical protein
LKSYISAWVFRYFIFIKTAGNEANDIIQKAFYLLHRMKKVSVFILSLLYITSSIGVTLTWHYCMNSPVPGNAGSKSKMGGMCGHEKTTKKPGECCKYENKLIKNVDEQKITESTSRVISPITITLPGFTEISTYRLPSLAATYLVNHAPPPKSNTALYIRNRVFRI